jgi:hypothetical protein
MPIDQLTAELELSPQVADFLEGQQFRASASTSPSIRSTIVLHRIAPVLTQHNPPAGDRRIADMHFAAPSMRSAAFSRSPSSTWLRYSNAARRLAKYVSFRTLRLICLRS